MRPLLLLILFIVSSAYSQTVTNLKSLRELRNPKHNDLVYVKGHTRVRDGGEGFFFYNDSLDLGDDDGGIIIKPKWNGHKNKGRWVRHLDGTININYFGVNAISANLNARNGWSVSDTIQKAIDFASRNTPYDGSRYSTEVTKGNTIFFPNGQYFLNKPLILKDGVTILGEEKTILSAVNDPGYNYLIKMDSLRVRVTVENLWLNGRHQGEVGGMLLESVKGGKDNDGGLWSSSFKNIKIVNILGHGIHLKGGDASSNFRTPNQFNIFEDIMIKRSNNMKKCLLMTGQNGQQTFINCFFEGRRGDEININENVLIESKVKSITSSVISFINCTFQLAEYGIVINNAHNITIDNCWFENLYVSIHSEDSRKINILNSRFSNAGGFGSLHSTFKYGAPGRCISARNSTLNIEKNFVNVTDRESKDAHQAKFVMGLGDNNEIELKDNEFQDIRLSTSSGVQQFVTIDNGSDSITIQGKKEVCINYSPEGNSPNNELRIINSTAGSGEMIYICASNNGRSGKLIIYAHRDGPGENIYLSGRSKITLSDGEWATFMKVDIPNESTGVQSTYQLISLSK
jgi:hypothetical protein